VEFVIDGYNLLHAVGRAPKPGGMSLERSRLRLLDWLATALGAQSADVLVVFDAVHGRGPTSETVHRGVRVQFSLGEAADDLIETMIAGYQPPSQLTVVSNDHRLQQAACRRGAKAWTCGEFVDWLAEKKISPAEPATAKIAEKPDLPSSQEVDDWLKRFGEK
jgi:predicted RNA-binding protein with PIN domain